MQITRRKAEGPGTGKEQERIAQQEKAPRGEALGNNAFYKKRKIRRRKRKSMRRSRRRKRKFRANADENMQRADINSNKNCHMKRAG